MFDKKYSKKQSILKVYYISRLWRLMPVFYTFSILGLIVNFFTHSNLFVHLDKYQKASAMVSNVIMLGYANIKAKILVPAWSLDVEMQFYLIFPLIAYFIKKNKSILFYVTALFFLVAMYIICFNHSFLLNTSITYLYLFFIGIIVYQYKLRPGIKIEKISIGILTAIILSQYLIPLLTPYRSGYSKYYTLLSLTLILFAIPSLINSVYRPSNEKDKFFGEMSFLLYLSHWVWIGPYNNLIQNGTKFARIPYVFGFLFVTFLSAYLVYKFIDRPSERLRHQWVNSRR